MATRDILQDVIDRLTDEGDRVYLGSTNDVERLKSVLATLPDEPACARCADTGMLSFGNGQYEECPCAD